MKFTAFKASDGDSILIEGGQANILVDGGRKGSFEDHVAPALEKLEEAGRKLDLLCVSHIDDDHITGIVELIRRRREWQVHEHQIAGPDPPNPDHPQPPFGKPPAIDHLWHNGFGETFDDAVAAGVTNALAFHAQLLSASATLAETSYGSRFGRLAQGARRAIELQVTLGASPMGIELNAPSQGERLSVVDPAQSVDFSGTEVHLLGPFDDTFAALQAEWDAWVSRNEEKIEEMKAEFQATQGSAPANALDFLAFAARVAQSGGLEGEEGIEPPNLASIMFLVEEGGRTVLMTGDGASPHVLRGLEAHNRLAAAPRGIHVDILKVPHHGADANTTVEFARRVTADNYVFCGNGRHDNPEVDVIRRYVEARVSDDPEIRTANPEAAGREFKLWFNYAVTDAAVTANENYLAIIEAARTEAELHAAAHPNIVEVEFSDQDSLEIPLA